MSQPKKFVLKSQPEGVNREIVFRWDEHGGAHIQHDEPLTLNEARMALGALACIVAGNEMMNGGRPAIREFFRRFQKAVLVYLGTAELARVAHLPTEEEIAAGMEEGREEARKEGLLS